MIFKRMNLLLLSQSQMLFPISVVKLRVQTKLPPKRTALKSKKRPNTMPRPKPRRQIRTNELRQHEEPTRNKLPLMMPKKNTSSKRMSNLQSEVLPKPPSKRSHLRRPNLT
jgi:hypothetical protein